MVMQKCVGLSHHAKERLFSPEAHMSAASLSGPSELTSLSGSRPTLALASSENAE
jgi:hypothetical protein